MIYRKYICVYMETHARARTQTHTYIHKHTRTFLNGEEHFGGKIRLGEWDLEWQGRQCRSLHFFLYKVIREGLLIRIHLSKKLEDMIK